MKHLAVVLAIIGLPLMGFAQQTIFGSITHDGMQRDYILYEPATYTGIVPVPLVLNYHGFGSNANDQMNATAFAPIADTAGFIHVCPQGTLWMGLTHWNVGGWIVGSTTDDVGFTDALIDSISSMYNIDPARIYSTGMSNGGFMSFLLACQLGDRIAAIASVAGSMTTDTYDACNPQRPTPALQIHGTADEVIPYDGNGFSLPVDDAIQYWVENNGCNNTPTITALPDTFPDDGSTVEHVAYYGGGSGVTVEHFKVIGGGHHWPGWNGNMDINASEEIWRFFSKFDIDGLIDTMCCEAPTRGNVDYDILDQVNVADLTYLVAYLFTAGPEPPCVDEGNMDGAYEGEFAITVSDLTFIVAYLFSGGPEPAACP